MSEEIKQLEAKLAKLRQEEDKKIQKQRAEYENKKADFLNQTINAFKACNRELTTLKNRAFADGAIINNLMYSLYNMKKNDAQKTFKIENEEKTQKVVIERAERLVFTEEAKVGIDLMRSTLKKKFASRNQSMYQIIDKLLSKNAKGDYDPKMVVKLKSFEKQVSDPNFTKAIDILTQSLTVDSTALYVRAYEKNDKGSYEDISLQFSSL